MTLKHAWQAFPLLLVIIAYFALNHLSITGLAPHLSPLTPYVLCAVLTSVSLIFNRSRLALASINICFAYGFIQQGLQQSLAHTNTTLLFLGTSCLYTTHLCLIGCYRERGSVSIWGVCRLSALVSSYGLLWWLHQSTFVDVTYALVQPHLSPLMDDKYWITPLWLINFTVSGILILLLIAWKRSAVEIALLVAWLGGALVFYDFSVTSISTWLFSIVLIACFIALIQIAYGLAFLDALTQQPGRRALYDKMGTLSGQYAIAMLDIDHFKKFNDTYGHETGDQVLKLVAAKIAEVRCGGSAYRYGGEEFTIVFPKKTMDLVEAELNHVRQCIADYPLAIRNNGRSNDKKTGKSQRGAGKGSPQVVHVSISIGLAQRSAPQDTPEAIMKLADQALYSAKKAGRNCVMTFDE